MRTGMVVTVVAVFILAAGPSHVVSQQQTVTVDIRDFSFEPRDLMVPAGTAVRWVNRDDAPHSLVMDGGRPGSSPGILSPGGEHTFIFREAGQFAYRCGVHPTMLGEITVQAP